MPKKQGRISLDIPLEEKQFFKEYAKRKQRSQTELFREFIRWLEERDRKDQSRF